ncbi:MAG: hypothetical protein J2P36_25965, partial [Ktedonobacteraceae bacterium]|nr:hypothetical protein [Ktedonobacteraceae bacterium]
RCGTRADSQGLCPWTPAGLCPAPLVCRPPTPGLLSRRPTALARLASPRPAERVWRVYLRSGGR